MCPRSVIQVAMECRLRLYIFCVHYFSHQQITAANIIAAWRAYRFIVVQQWVAQGQSIVLNLMCVEVGKNRNGHHTEWHALILRLWKYVELAQSMYRDESRMSMLTESEKKAILPRSFSCTNWSPLKLHSVVEGTPANGQPPEQCQSGIWYLKMAYYHIIV